MSHRIEPVAFTGEPGDTPGDEVFVELTPGSPGAARMVFCWCPKPERPFQMGSPESEQGRESNERAHHVLLSRGFWLAKHPYNQAQYAAVTDANPSSSSKGGDYPVDTVSWDDAQAFCKKAARMANLPKSWRFGLPTEAEREYACRAGGPFEHPFGIGDGRNVDAQRANFDGTFPYADGFKWQNRKSTVHEGSFPPNAWGLHDMHGQLWEWCEDWLGDYARSSEEAPSIDPIGASKGGFRVLRGGYWDCDGGHCRSA